MSGVRTVLHCCLVMLSFAAALAAWLCLLLAIGVALVADAVQPQPQRSNCWAFALPRWWRDGGYLGMRRTDVQHLQRWLPLLHVLHIEDMSAPGVNVLHWQYSGDPTRKWWPWEAAYFEGSALSAEAPHKALPARRAEP